MGSFIIKLQLPHTFIFIQCTAVARRGGCTFLSVVGSLKRCYTNMATFGFLYSRFSLSLFSPHSDHLLSIVDLTFSDAAKCHGLCLNFSHAEPWKAITMLWGNPGQVEVFQLTAPAKPTWRWTSFQMVSASSFQVSQLRCQISRSWAKPSPRCSVWIPDPQNHKRELILVVITH